MGTIQVVKTDRMMQGKVRIEIEVRTSVGRMTFPIDIDDQGSLGQTEKAAYLELQKLLEESLALVQPQLG